MSAIPFARVLRTRREAAKLTQRSLAERTGVKQPLISAIEHGNRQASEATRATLRAALPIRPSQLLAAKRQEVLDLLASRHITEPQVFGSVARGDDRPDSDIDLLVRFPPEADIVDLLELADELSNLVGAEVDLVALGSSGALLEHALAEAVPL